MTRFHPPTPPTPPPLAAHFRPSHEILQRRRRHQQLPHLLTAEEAKTTTYSSPSPSSIGNPAANSDGRTQIVSKKLVEISNAEQNVQRRPTIIILVESRRIIIIRIEQNPEPGCSFTRPRRFRRARSIRQAKGWKGVWSMRSITLNY